MSLENEFFDEPVEGPGNQGGQDLPPDGGYDAVDDAGYGVDDVSTSDLGDLVDDDDLHSVSGALDRRGDLDDLLDVPDGDDDDGPRYVISDAYDTDDDFEMDDAPREVLSTHEAPPPERQLHQGPPSTDMPLRITAVVRPIENDKRSPVDQPNPDAIAAEIQQGRPVQMDIVRDTPNGEIVIGISSNALKARGAEVAPLPKHPVPATVNGDKAPPVDAQFTAWGVIEEERLLGPDKKQEAPTPPDGEEKRPARLAIGELVARTDKPFKITILGEQVLPDQYTAVQDSTDDKISNAEGLRSAAGDRRARNLQVLKREVEEGAGGTLAHRYILVGATDDDSLREIMGLAPGLVIGSEGTRMTAKELPDKKLFIARDRAQAMEQCTLTPHSVVTPDRLARDMGMPVDSELFGVRIKDQYNFGVNREIPAGATVAEGPAMIVDDEGVRRPYQHPIDVVCEHIFWGGKPGSGKTKSAEEILASTVAASFARYEQNPDIKPIKLVVVNGRKSDDTARHVAELMAGYGIAEEFTGVRTNRPGARLAGIPVIIDVHSTQMETIKEAIETGRDTLAIGISGDANTVRMAYRYLLDGVVKAAEALGGDAVGNVSKYPHGEPASPKPAFVAYWVRESLKEGSWQPKAVGDIGEWTAGPLEMQPFTISGDFFRGGEPIDFQKLIADFVPDGFDFDKFGNDNTSRQISALALLNGIWQAVKAENGSDAHTSHARVLVHFEEAYGLFDDTPIGEALATLILVLRSYGIGISISQQGGYDKLHPMVLRSMGSIYTYQTDEEGDIQALSEAMMISDANKGYLRDKLLPKGQGLVVSPGHPLARIASTHPWDREYRPVATHSNRDIADLRLYEGFFTDEQIEELPVIDAEAQLTRTVEGARIRIEAGLNVALVLTRRLPQKMVGDRLAAMQGLTGPKALLRDTMIVKAVDAAVDGRPDVMYATTRARMKEFIITRMLAEVRGQALPRELAPPEDMSLVHSRYNPAIDRIADRLTADKVALTDGQNKALGSLQRTKTGVKYVVGGTCASEQLDVIDNAEKRSTEEVKKAVISKIPNKKAATHLAKLIVGASTQPIAPKTLLDEIEKRMGYTSLSVAGQGPEYVRMQVETRMHRPMSDDELKAFAGLVDKMPDVDPNETYPAVRRILTKAIVDKYVDEPPTDVTTLERFLYGGQKFAGDTSRAQLADALDKRDAVLENCEYRDKVDEQSAVFGHDQLEGGVDLDNAVATVMAFAEPHGPMTAQLKRQLGTSGKARLTYGKLLEAGDPRKSAWRTTFTKQFLYSKHYKRRRSVTGSLVRIVSRTVRDMQADERSSRAMIKNNIRKSQ